MRMSKSKRTRRWYRATGIAAALAVAIGAMAPSATAAPGTPAPPQSIVGGSDAQVGQYPSLAAIFVKVDGYSAQERFICTGTVIDPTHVLTAAHCGEVFFDYPVEVQVGSRDLGDPGATVVDATSIAISSRWYDGTTISEDLGIITLAKPVNVPVSRLATKPDKVLTKGTRVVEIAGWGLTEHLGVFERPAFDATVPVRAQGAQLKTVPTAKCAKLYDADVYRGFVVPATDICAGSRMQSGCYGDSGGPMYVRDRRTGSLVQVGVTSRGAGCATQFPGVWTNVGAMASWIAANRNCTAPLFPSYPEVPIYAC